MLETIIRRLKSNRRGLSNVIVVMLSLVLMVIIVGNVVLWSYQMNQLDWEKMQERTALTNVEHVTYSPWFTSQNEYIVNIGNHMNGTYRNTWTVDSNYETFAEQFVTTYTFNPSGYTLGGSTKYISGTVTDLLTDNSMYMVFRSYSSVFSPQTLYAHLETVAIVGTPYYQLGLESADTSGLTFEADASTTGRKLLGKFVYPLTGVTSIPTSTWTFYYRAYKTGPDAQVIAHCDVDILVRKTDGTIRTIIATDVANSSNLNRDTWTTVSADYVWSNYTVVNDTDFLEVDYYAHITTGQSGRRAYLRVDDSSLAISDQTSITSVMLPCRYAVEIELTGSSNTLAWKNLTWTIDNAFTTGNVNVTLQLYNYNTNQYPTSGDGYINYNSSSTPNMDETRNQTISTNPTYFRGASGEWKVKFIGVKEATSLFDLKVDWAEFKVITSLTTYRLDINGEFTLDLTEYPLAYVNSIEIQIRYRANDSLENWFLKAYNWTSGKYSNTGFNSTEGDTPTTEFKCYAVNLTNVWQSYVQNGIIIVKFCDNDPDTNLTLVDIDFLSARLIVDGARFSFENEGSLTTRVVAIWIINTTVHKRYEANFFLNSGERGNYLRVDIPLSINNFTVRAVTERGNIAVFTMVKQP